MVNKNWAYGTDPETGLNRQLRLVGHNFLEPQDGGRITVFLAVEIETPNGWKKIGTADYAIEQGKISYDVDGEALPKKNIDGTFVYVLDENGNPTDVIADRDNAYDNIVYYVDNKVMSIYQLIDEGVVERFKLPM
jgi:hypothetical protein